MVLNTPELVRDFCRSVDGSAFIAVDTEFKWERTYYADLSLVQLATPERVGLVDCLAVNDLSPLRELLCTPTSLKVFHSASQDLSILGRALGRCVCNIYDTQIGHALLGGPHQASYAKLVDAYLGLVVDKSIQHTDWLQRPLSENQLAYARADVVHLAEIYPIQRDRLAQEGRLEWAREDCRWLEDNPPSEETPEDELHRVVKGWGRLEPRQLHNLRQLALWRESYCREHNLRPRWLIADSAMLGFARKGRFHTSVVAGEKPWIAKRIRKLSAEIAGVLTAAADCPDEQLPRREKRKRPTQQEKRLVDLADRMITDRAEELGLEKALLSSRSDFTSLVRYMVHHGEAPSDARLLTGWRGKEIGNMLIDRILPECKQAPLRAT